MAEAVATHQGHAEILPILIWHLYMAIIKAIMILAPVQLQLPYRAVSCQLPHRAVRQTQ